MTSLVTVVVNATSAFYMKLILNIVINMHETNVFFQVFDVCCKRRNLRAIHNYIRAFRTGSEMREIMI